MGVWHDGVVPAVEENPALYQEPSATLTTSSQSR